MNTAVKIKSCSKASASAKIDYLENETKADKKIILLEKNKIINDDFSLTSEQQKEYRKAQKDLSCYQKRLDKAIKDGKEKSIKTNQNNIKKAQAILLKFENRPDKREKYFTEFTIALTNSQGEKYDDDWSKRTLEYIKQEFPTLKVISAVEHQGQHSPHMHILLHSKDQPITQVLAQQTGEKDTSRESMKKAYSKIAHNFHLFANSNIALNELETLKKGRKYVSLGQYKAKGNFEARKGLKRKKKEELDYLLENKSKLESKIKNIDFIFKNAWRDEVNFTVVNKPKTFWFKEYSFVTLADIKREHQSKKEVIKKFEEFEIDIEEEAKEINKHFNWLLTAKRSKDREYKHWEKEEVIIVEEEPLKQFLESLNGNIKKIYEKLKELLEKTHQELNQVKEKISKDPMTIDQKRKRELEREKEQKEIREQFKKRQNFEIEIRR